MLPLLVVGLSAGLAAAATPGDLDSSFDLDGKVTSAVGASYDNATSVAIQSDGKIVVAGYTDNGSNYDFAVVRYLTDGTLDTTFDGDVAGNGIVTTALGAHHDIGRSVKIQSDGKIVVAGYSNNGSNYDFAVARFLMDGKLDPAFGTGGIATTALGANHDFGRSVAIQSDGKIVVGGYSDNGTNNDFAVVRYLSTGVLDTTFDGDGKATMALGAGDDFGESVAIQSDGKVVVGGYTNNGSNNDFAVARFLSNGTPDTDFDGDGSVRVALGSGEDLGISVAIQSDGKIVVGGYSSNGSDNDFAVVRYLSNATLDTAFDGDGKVTTAIGGNHDFGQGVAIQSDGKIVVGGYSYNGSNNDFAVVRYLSSGALDTTFGGDGKVTAALGAGDDLGLGVAMQSDGKIVVAGYTNNGSDYDFAGVRYLITGCADGLLQPGEDCDLGASNGSADSCCSASCTYAPSSTSCRASAGACDTEEFCSGGGGTCPSDAKSTAVCRAATGDCDVAESCNGVSTTCPADANAASGTPCADDGNVCKSDICDGAGVCTHPNNTASCNDGAFCNGVDTCSGGSCVHAGNPCTAGTECADACNETADNCFDVAGTACTDDGNACKNDICDGAGVCAHPNNTAPCSDSVFCNGADTCSGGSCVHAGNPCAAGTECADACNETADNCFDAAGTACTDDGNVCKNDVCNGAGVCAHPNNTAPCSDGVFCNGVDTCSGGSCVHPGNPCAGGTVCADTCNEAADNCFDASGTACDDSLFCNGVDTCSGAGVCSHTGDPCTGGTDCANACNEGVDNCLDLAGAPCTDDGNVCKNDICNGTGTCTHPNNASLCEDGDLCTGPDACVDGACVTGDAINCDDRNLCTVDTCDVDLGCENVAELLPESLCLTAGKIRLQIKRSDNPAKNQLKWRWGGGEAFDQSDLGTPNLDTAYALCVYDTTASVPTLAASVDVAPGPVWLTQAPKGWTYTDKEETSDGVQLLQLKTGDDGKTKAQVKSGGVDLPIPTPLTGSVYFDQDPSVIVQLLSSEGMCLTSEFASSNALRNDATQFKVTAP